MPNATMPLSIIVDSREQAPFRFEGHPCYAGTVTTTGTLQTGDYSLAGLEHLVAIERKSVSDLIGVLYGQGRERFERELVRAKGLDAFAVIVEGSWQELARGEYRSQVLPHAVCQSVAAFTARLGIPFWFAGSRPAAAYCCWSFLKQYAEGKRKELKALEKALAGKAPGTAA